MIKNALIAILTLFTISFTSIHYVNDKKLIEKLEQKEEDARQASIKIANLESDIVEKSNDLIENKMVIEEKDIQIEEYKKKLDEYSKSIKEEAEKAKAKAKSERAETTNATNEGVVKTLVVNASAYTAKCNGCSGITATGYDVRNTLYYQGYRVIATDPRVIPTYSILEVEGFSEKFIALDTGGAIKGNKVDILMKTKSDAYSFGRKNVKVKVLKLGNK